MLFNSIHFMTFFPIVVFIYFVIPGTFKKIWLLAASYYFYMSWNPKYAILIITSTVLTYGSGLFIEKYKDKERKCCQHINKYILVVCLISNLSILAIFKYGNFFIDSFNRILKQFHISTIQQRFDFLLPVGISFYTFQALGYIIDVYRGDIKAEKNLLQYALFISFFPQLVAGPIERSKNLLSQLKDTFEFDVDNAKNGLLTMAYGLFMKIAVADNISVVIDPIFDSPDDHSGMILLFATIMFAFQIYCDFNGYTQIAIGSAKVLGVGLSQNFESPYMGCSVKDFWRRWHISLTSWFRDYLYIPLGGGKKGKFRKQINTMIIFLCSGLWHGAGWHFIVWGALNGLFSVFEDIMKPIKGKIDNHLSIDKEKWMYKVFQRIITFTLIDFTWLFFRAPSLTTALHMLKKIVNDFRLAWLINFNFVSAFESAHILMTVMIPLFIIAALDVIKYYGKDIKATIFSQQIVFRWTIYAAIMLAILYWGLYGTGYEQTQFIYFQF